MPPPYCDEMAWIREVSVDAATGLLEAFGTGRSRQGEVEEAQRGRALNVGQRYNHVYSALQCAGRGNLFLSHENFLKKAESIA